MKKSIRSLGIVLNELPQRAAIIGREEITKIFGGCGAGEGCIQDKDCCPTYKCIAGTLSSGATASYCISL